MRIKRPSNRLASVALAISLTMTGQGCWFTGNGTATDRFAVANYELAGLIGDAQTAIRDSLKLRVLSPERALTAATIIETKANLIQQKLLRELVERLKVNGAKEELVITEGDKGMLLGLINLLADAATEIINDPAILSLDSATRAGVTAAILGIRPITILLASLIQKTPAGQRIAPSLRQQLGQSVDRAEQFRAVNDQLFVQIQILVELR